MAGPVIAKTDPRLEGYRNLLPLPTKGLSEEDQAWLRQRFETPPWIQALAIMADLLPAMTSHVGFHGTQGPFTPRQGVTWFAKKKADALDYALNRRGGSDPRVYKAQLNMDRPLSGSELYRIAQDLGIAPESALSQADLLSNPALLSEIKSRGFDGLVDAWDFGYGAAEIPVNAVFDPASIRSVRQVKFPPK